MSASKLKLLLRVNARADITDISLALEVLGTRGILARLRGSGREGQEMADAIEEDHKEYCAIGGKGGNS